MPQVGGGAALEDDEIEDAALLAAPENDEDDAQPAELGDEETAEAEAEPELTDEQRARTMGWHPLVEYRGDPRRWVPAAEFIRRAETEVPIMRDQNRRLQEKVAKLDGVVAGLQVTAQEQLTAIKEMRELARKSDQRGYDRAIAELKEQRREAVEAGDTAAFDQIEARIDEAQKERAATAPKETTTATAPVVDPDIAAFTSRRDVAPWWNKDEQLTRAMIDHHSIIKGMHPAMSLSDQLELAFRRVKADFPAQFGAEEEPDSMADPPTPTPRPAARPSTVARPSPPGGPGARVRSRWEQIADPAERAEAKAAYARQKRQMPDYTEDEYLDIYLEPHADALAVQTNRRAK